MSSLITKATKRRSVASHKARTTRGKKSAARKPQRPGRITSSPKPRKAAKLMKAAKKKSSKAAAAPKKITKRPKAAKQKSKAKSTPARKQLKKALAKKPATRTVAGSRGRKNAVASAAPMKAKPKLSKAVLRRRQLLLRPIPAPPPPKRPPSPGTLAAVRAFEAALKLFNRHDFGGAKQAFDNVLSKFEDEAEVTARARTYLAICTQRLARAASVPRNADALYDQGVFELNRGRNREAAGFFEKALKTDPRADHVFYSLAAAFARLNELNKPRPRLCRSPHQ